ncbi:MAG: MFS transporter [Spirochaetaceae bacterium]|nr:MAG: MFS transporter [Spirochaetaceae bacterium]
MTRLNRVSLSWAMYDWANSAFTTTIMAGFFPVFFKAYWSAGADAGVSTFWLGVSNSLASLIVAAIAPILGTIADKASVKKRFLLVFAFIGSASSVAFWFVAQGQWVLAMAVYTLGVLGFSGGNIFYDALLPSASNKKTVDFVSSLGFSLGYIGGGLLFAVNVIMYLFPDIFGFSSDVVAIRFSFLTVGIWWALFTIPLLINVAEKARQGTGSDVGDDVASGKPAVNVILQSFKELWTTFKHIRKLKYTALFLLAYWFYIDGVDTVIRMAVDFGASLDFSASSLITALLITQFVAFPATLIYAGFASKVGLKPALLTAIVAYFVLTSLGALMQVELHFYLLAVAVGLFQGGIQALSRSMFSRLVPPGKEGEFFGFFNMFGKFAAIIGPLLVGFSTLITHSNRIGILSLLLLFGLGFFLLLKVDIKEGIRAAEEYGK